MQIELVHKQGPLFEKSRFKDTKDPCPVFDGKIWHIYGSGGSVVEERWQILHATAPAKEGPWTEEEPVKLMGIVGSKDHVAAPGVVYDENEKQFHMFVQTDFLAENGTVEYLTSSDGHVFVRKNTAIHSVPETEEAGIYDPHPAVINGKKYIVYSGTPRVTKTLTFFISRPDIFLAESETGLWFGPWKRLGKILDHAAIAWHHNQVDQEGYEWGIEGPQLLQLPNGKILLNATCFLPLGVFGTRQRTFFAIADSVMGPYTSLGPVIHTHLDTWESGENGHAAAVIEKNTLYLFYQARANIDERGVNYNDWRYGLATFNLKPILKTEKEKGDQ